MKIIGEKINGTRKRVGAAILARDAAYIENLALRQVEGGADWLDINAGTAPEREADDLVWLVRLAQNVTDRPLCLDSANPSALRAALGETRQTPLINSISGEPARLQGVLPVAAEFACPVIALCMDETGIPATADGRMAVIRKVFAATREAGVPDERVYVDPLALAIATNTEAANVIFQTMRALRGEFPQARIVCGLSNISFGLPLRSLINRTFLALALDAGLDAAIIDPNDRELTAAIYAAELLLGRDRHCLRYTRAYRAGKLESSGEK